MGIIATPTTIADVSARVKIYDTRWGSHSFGTSSNTQAWAKCSYYIDYANVVLFTQLVNGIFLDQNGVNQTPNRLPMTCPIWSAIIVSETKSTPYGVDATCGCSNPYLFAEVEITFATPKYEQTGDNTLLNIEYDVADEICSLPGSSYSFGDGTRGEVGIGIPIVTTAIQITRYRVPTVDLSTFQSVAGKINSATFFGCDPNYVLCSPLRSSSKQDFGGAVLNDVTYGFKLRSIPWTYALNPNSGQFEQYSPQTLGTADLNVLFSS